MNRLGLLEKGQLDGAQVEAYDQAKAYADANYKNKFVYIDSEERLLGPFGVQLHHPEVSTACSQFARALRNIPGLEAGVRECAILAVAYKTDAAYERYAHEISSGFREEDLVTLRSGKCPETFTPSQKSAYRVAQALPGRLDSATWKDAVETIGLNGTAALIHYVGFYNYISSILNGFDVQVPK